MKTNSSFHFRAIIHCLKARQLFWTLPVLVGVLLAAMLISARRTKASPSPAITPAQSKLTPWVLANTDNSQTAEFFVLLADQADLSELSTVLDRDTRAKAVATRLREHAQRTQAPLLAWLRANGLSHQTFYLVNAVLVTGTRAVAEALAARADVARIEGNPAIHNPAIARPSAEELAQLAERAAAPQAIEPGLTVIHAPEVWNLGYKGNGIVIGSVDSGVEWTHPALRNRYRGTVEGFDYNWCDTTGGVTCKANSEPIDDHGHGTHTIGTALGYDGGSNQIGVAPEAKFMACRAMDANLIGTPNSYLKCLEWMLKPYPIGGDPVTQGDINKRPDIVLAAWTCPPSEGCAFGALSTAVSNLRNAGIPVVTMAGSNGPACSTVFDPPGIYSTAYTVGAVNSLSPTTIVPATFSSRGPVTVDGSNRMKPDLAAPGVGVRSARAGSGYVEYSGTSMAAAHVAGAIALLWSARPVLRGNLTQTQNYLSSGAVSMPTTECNGNNTAPNNVTGFGLLNIKQTVDNAVNAGTLRAVKADFDGDRRTDLSVFRPSVVAPTPNWFVINSGNNATITMQWGAGYAPYNDVIVPGDYDGDGKADHAIWRGADSLWYIRPSATPNSPIVQLWGANYAPYFDIPTPGDYDGDGKTDVAVFRRSGTWFVKRSSDGMSLIQTHGQQDDIPVPADYDGDGKTDLAVFRPLAVAPAPNWLILQSTTNTVISIQWGAGYAPYNDQPVPADYDGDGKTDLAIWRGADEIWYIRKSSDGQFILQLWGTSNSPYFDIPTPGDYDGDGKADIAVWRPSTAEWYIKRSSNGSNLIQAHGQSGDVPCPSTGIR
ncbi:MAG: S8 family serine peptidase [Acidobacteria bacterium]|nr:S8 family serine peptidase [Acidobacteriota bacterium]MBI3425796.1 S8 family serine peptidase [Acidobacteriota bacterium]